jgi:hypothetical protein
MAFELKDGQGSFFKNAKDGVEARPDYRGEFKWAGTMFKISGWIKEGPKGKWMSLSIEEKDTERAAIQGEQKRAKVEAERDPW